MSARTLTRALLALAAVTGASSFARADATDRCIAESETGQRLTLERHFVEARPHLVACGRAQCPTVVTRDCVERLREVEASLASVLLSAKGPDGADALDARVFVDDARAPLRPSGDAVLMNPGLHRFRFERPGVAPVVREVRIDEGARLLSVAVSFAGPAPAASRAAGAPPREEPPPSTNGQRTAAYAVGGTGALAAAVGAVFGLFASARLSRERSECGSPTTCTDHAAAQRDYDDATSFGTVSTIAFVASGALVAAGVTLWLTAPTSGAAPSRGVGLVPAVAASQGGLTLRGAF